MEHFILGALVSKESVDKVSLKMLKFQLESNILMEKTLPQWLLEIITLLLLLLKMKFMLGVSESMDNADMESLKILLFHN